MTALGTDLLAWACIVGSAATSGGLTLAFLGDGEESAPMECQIETRSDGHRMVVSGQGGAVVMTVPSMTARLNHECGSVLSGQILLREGFDADEIRLHVEDLRREVQDARVHIEISRAEAELAREMARVVRIRRPDRRAFSDQARKRMQEAQAQMVEALERATEAELEAAEHVREVSVIVKRAGEGKGGG